LLLLEYLRRQLLKSIIELEKAEKNDYNAAIDYTKAIELDPNYTLHKKASL
jgi:hypothetical protein